MFSFCRCYSKKNLPHDTENVLQAILKTAPSAIVVIDEESRIVEWSCKAETLFGYLREEVLNESITDIIIPPQHRNGHLQGVKRYLETRQTHLIGKGAVYLTAVHRDGHTFPITLTLNESITADGHLLFLGFMVDITETNRLRVEFEQMDRTYRTLRSFLTNVPAPIAVFDVENWNCTFSNKAFTALVVDATEKDLLDVLWIKGSMLKSTQDGKTVCCTRRQLNQCTYDIELTRISIDDKYLCMIYMSDITSNLKIEEEKASLLIREQIGAERAIMRAELLKDVVYSITPPVQELDELFTAAEVHAKKLEMKQAHALVRLILNRISGLSRLVKVDSNTSSDKSSQHKEALLMVHVESDSEDGSYASSSSDSPSNSSAD